MRMAGGCLLLVGLTLFAPQARALRCGTDLVREGDPAYEVRRACGEPDWIGSYHYYGHVSSREVWQYNFGPNALIRVLRFRDGRLQRIESAGRGFVEPDAPGDCRPGDIVQGMSAPELLQRCGEPVQREVRRVVDRFDRPGLRRHDRRHRFHRVLVEDWYYDFGRGYLPRRLRLEDGIVTRIETTP